VNIGIRFPEEPDTKSLKIASFLCDLCISVVSICPTSSWYGKRIKDELKSLPEVGLESPTFLPIPLTAISCKTTIRSNRAIPGGWHGLFRVVDSMGESEYYRINNL
jgi:hypothetical protein